MTTAILDTNVLVQGLISSSRSASSRVLDACYDGRFRLVYSPDVLDELIEVLSVSHIRSRHGLSDEEILEFVASLLSNADSCSGNRQVAHDIARDMTDTKFLALAEESDADYLVTNDRRHLLRLGEYAGTHIVTPTVFLRHLS